MSSQVERKYASLPKQPSVSKKIGCFWFHIFHILFKIPEKVWGYFTILSPASMRNFARIESCTKAQIISLLRDSSSETFISHLYMAADGNASALVQVQAELIHAII